MKELDFEKLKEEKISFLKDHHTIVLATSKDDEVMARAVSCSTEGLDFYILSWISALASLGTEDLPILLGLAAMFTGTYLRGLLDSRHRSE
jgi:nitroimidazol reductase NimA-like FMN-containing flavoprotein (pyridoxamine 5'-phosphate oxidase superfamily)